MLTKIFAVPSNFICASNQLYGPKPFNIKLTNDSRSIYFLVSLFTQVSQEMMHGILNCQQT